MINLVPRISACQCAAVWSAVLIAGCGGTYDATVAGVATYNGSPLQRGTVKFIPESSGPSGYGLINDVGSYSIMTGREEGLPAGAYTVTVVANEPSSPNPNPSLPPMPGKAITPPWYRDSAYSPLKHTVEPGSNEINLDLTSQPPAGWNTRARR
jgi:hypothetical protein